MNRTERRAAARAKPLPRMPRYLNRQPGKIIKPWPHEVHRVFAPIEWMFDELGRGEITELNGVPAFRDIDGGWFAVVPALEGWLDAWQRLDQQFSLGIDFGAVRHLSDALERNEMMTAGDVEAAFDVIVQCREAFRDLDVYAVKKVVRETESAIALGEQKGE